jgi:membrane-bound lytic murein transglycosylase A
MKHAVNFLLLGLIILSVAGCTRTAIRMPAPSAVALIAVPAEQVDLNDDLDFASLELAIDRSVQYYEGSSQNSVYRMADKLIGAKQLKESLLAFRKIIRNGASIKEKKNQIRQDFDIYRAAGDDEYGGVLFTGYYEPLLEGSLTPTDKYRYPLYKPPPDLVMKAISKNETKISRMKNGEAVPYYTRREIDVEGVLKGRGLELAWVADPVELSTLHIQGSGKIKLEDGRMLTVSYAQNNGRPFRSVTRYMLDNGMIKGSESSYRNVKSFLKSKKEQELFEILSYNEKYIFFRFVDKEPVGSLGQPVTPDRSIATDPDYFPQGTLAFIRLRKPLFDAEGNIKERVPFSRFVLSQDKGSAIKGPGRVDLFCGFGANAQSTAGSLKEKGELYFLIKK